MPPPGKARARRVTTSANPIESRPKSPEIFGEFPKTPEFLTSAAW